jgi:hypothetical protein
MSIRNSIADNIVKTIRETLPVYVTREELELEKLARTQFPAVLVETGPETRTHFSMGFQSSEYRASVDYFVHCYVNGSNIDELRNDIAGKVEVAVVADQSRGGIALETMVEEINVNNDIANPHGEIILTVRVDYIQTRGNV